MSSPSAWSTRLPFELRDPKERSMPSDRPASGGEGASGAGGSYPEPTFTLLLAGIAAQGQIALGLLQNPITKETKKDLPQARHAIGLIEMLETKTKGNLDAAEHKLMNDV